MANSVRQNAERILAAVADYVERECSDNLTNDKMADVINYAGKLANDLLYDERERAMMQRKGAGFHDHT